MMDCKRLKADIKQLREARDAFKSAADEMNETGRGKAKCNECLKQASEVEDKVLGNYLENFVEKNPDFFEYEYVDDIKGLEKVGGSILSLGDDKILAYGGWNELAIYQKQANGSYELIQSFELTQSFDDFDDDFSVGGAEILSGGNILLTNYRKSEIYGFLRRDKEGSYSLEEFSESDDTDIWQVLNLSDGDVLAYASKRFPDGEKVGVIKYHFDESGYSSQGFNELCRLDEARSLYSMRELSNGDVLVSSWAGWGVLTHGNNSSSSFNRYELQFCEEKVDSGTVCRVFDLQNGDFLLWTDQGHFFVIEKDNDGKYSRVGEAKCVSCLIDPSKFVQCDNGDILALGSHGEVALYCPERPADGFKLLNEGGRYVEPVANVLHKLSDGRIVAGTDKGLIYINCDEYGNYEMAYDTVKTSLAFMDDVTDMIDLSAGNVLIRGTKNHFGLLQGGVAGGLDSLKKQLSKIASKASAGN